MKSFTITSTNGNFTIEAENKAAAISKAKAFCKKHGGRYLTCVDHTPITEGRVTKAALWTNEMNLRRWHLIALADNNKHWNDYDAADLSMAISRAHDEEIGSQEIIIYRSTGAGLMMVEKHKKTGALYVSIIGEMVEAMQGPLTQENEFELSRMTGTDAKFWNTIHEPDADILNRQRNADV